jgi:glycoprotein endo-alpha-1,2-mannosidase
MWEAALVAQSTAVGITSWNEWGEGTQIEAAEPRTIDVAELAPAGRALDARTRAVIGAKDKYEDYEPGGPQLYLELTLRFAGELAAQVAAAEEEERGERASGRRQEL